LLLLQQIRQQNDHVGSPSSAAHEMPGLGLADTART
jgi:hypothetical protein